MEFWLRRGKLSYSFDVPDEADVIELKPRKDDVGISPSTEEEVHRSLEEADVILLDYVPFFERYMEVLSKLGDGLKEKKVIISTLLVGDDLSYEVLQRFRESGLDALWSTSEDFLMDLSVDAMKGIGKLAYVRTNVTSPLIEGNGLAGRLKTSLTGTIGIQPIQVEKLVEGITSLTFINLILDPEDRSCVVVLGDGPVDYEVRVKKRFEAVIVSAGGDPLDQTFVLGVNALLSASPLVDDGGTIVLVSECGRGLGSKFVLRSALSPPTEEPEGEPYVSRLMRILRKLSKRCRVGVVTSLPKTYVEGVFGLKAFDTIQEAISHIVRSHGKDFRGCIVPYGNLTRPIIEV